MSSTGVATSDIAELERNCFHHMDCLAIKIHLRRCNFAHGCHFGRWLFCCTRPATRSIRIHAKCTIYELGTILRTSIPSRFITRFHSSSAGSESILETKYSDSDMTHTVSIFLQIRGVANHCSLCAKPHSFERNMDP